MEGGGISIEDRRKGRKQERKERRPEQELSQSFAKHAPLTLYHCLNLCPGQHGWACIKREQTRIEPDLSLRSILVLFELVPPAPGLSIKQGP